MELSEMIKEARIKKGMTQQELANSVYVTRQTISKWELGKSVPDEASLSLLYQCLEIDNKERNILKKFATNKQTIFLIIIAIVFSPAVIGIRYCLFKMGKLEDRKFKIMIQSIGFVFFALYFRTLKDNVAFILVFMTSIGYITYRYYLLSLERKAE
ncbi:helix-turn-helix domain-containing protein [Lachnoclostridium sp. An181]|uniref:helix-turn-helix domain-containing protein n=1 Tax=Lachnoclostridium sp. An181 TaxID=1965575 RepID=UPI00194F68E2|nr:helix-turn-helix transcriptional regulator [Lachnoclostridium sp. An181]